MQSGYSRKELSAFMEMQEGCCDFCIKSQGVGNEERIRHDIEWAAVGDVAGDAGHCQTMPGLEDHVKQAHK